MVQKYSENLLFKIMLLAIISFIILIFLIKTTFITTNFNLPINNWFLLQHNPKFDIFWVSITKLGSYKTLIPVVLSCFFVLLFYKQYKVAFLWLLASIGATLDMHLAKIIIQNQRPENMFYPLNNYSFPSGHTMMSFFVLVGFIFLIAPYIPKIIAKVMLITTSSLSLLIAISRLYLGVHWLTDIIGGLLLAIAWITLMLYFSTIYQAKKLPTYALIATFISAFIISGSIILY